MPLTFNQIYPAERLAETEEHLMDVWRGDVRRTYSCISMMPNYRQLEDPIQQAGLAARNLLGSGKYPGWNMPRLVADFGTVSTAAYWGGRKQLPVGGCLSIQPVVHNVDEAESLLPALQPSDGDVTRSRTLYADVCERLEIEPYQRLYTTTLDFQGPLNTAALLWEQMDFMASMYENPKVIHRFLDKVTDFLIQIMEASLEGTNGHVCGNVWPYIWLPSDLGIAMTEDYMPLLSTEMYREFGIPYVERISRHFGGLFLHCCGAFKHQLMNLRDADINLLGLEFSHPYTKLVDIYNVFEDSLVIVPHMGPKAAEEYASKAAFLGDLIKKAPREARLWLILHPEDKDFIMQMTIVQAHITSFKL
ncbi:hypothetical protein AGMMS49992_02630 [Clostridia bacterium]|nr:hypothetical protein AGMMS49992_02630 [Clostridia bacterium]